MANSKSLGSVCASGGAVQESEGSPHERVGSLDPSCRGTRDRNPWNRPAQSREAVTRERPRPERGSLLGQRLRLGRCFQSNLKVRFRGETVVELACGLDSKEHESDQKGVS